MEYEGVNLVVEFLEEMENIGWNLNIDGTFLPKEFHMKLIIKETQAEKILNQLLEAKFFKFKKMDLVVAEILRKARNSTYHWSHHIQESLQTSRHSGNGRNKKDKNMHDIVDIGELQECVLLDSLMEAYVDTVTSVQAKSFHDTIEKLDLYVTASKKDVFTKVMGVVLQDLTNSLLQKEI